MEFLKRRLPLTIVFLTGVLLIISYYVPHKPFMQIWTGSSGWYMVIAAFTLVLGVTSLIRSHYLKIRRGKEGWGYSIIMFLGMIVTAVFGLIPVKYGPLFGDKTGSVFMWIFDYVNVAAASSVFSILAFYIASAAYRAFRVRTFDATVMLITALIVMVGRVPLGEMFSETISPRVGGHLPFLRLDNLTSFFLNFPTVAAKRAIFLGLALATVSTSLRIILGIERTYMGSQE